MSTPEGEPALLVSVVPVRTHNHICRARAPGRCHTQIQPASCVREGYVMYWDLLREFCFFV
ncbi:hypothetical protein BD309DRAFT_971539 [Dichomitus squalens]|nr:hypothetical protein BD309DRAFT_971539 [Dichomitus squalens]